MKNIYLTTVFWGALLISGFPLMAGDYFNPSDYQYNMTVTGTLLIDNLVISAEDTLFAYAGDECRGLISPEFKSDPGNWYVYLVIHGSGESEAIIFKYFNKANDTLIDLHNQVSFEIDGILGNPGVPYVFSDKAVMVFENQIPMGINISRSNEYLYIELDEQMLFSIVDLRGSIIFNQGLEKGRTSIPLDGFLGEIYILRFQNHGSIYTAKVRF